MTDRFVTSRLLAAVPGVHHAFSTRTGGVSTGAFASLNLTYGRDDAANVDANRRRLREAARLHGPWIEVGQVHGAGVVDAEAVDPTTEADAIVVDRPGVFAAVRTADCVPVLAVALDGRDRPAAVAAIHAGWRGAAAGIIRRTLTRLLDLGFEPTRLRLALGPAISMRHFEVGPEVVTAASRSLGGATPPGRPGPRGRLHLDLKAWVKRQIEAAGVPGAYVETSPHCTFRDADAFFSHRRQRGRCGHHLSLVGFVS